jgi:HCOMODA/2-hydroxy-3-carboxy-muconic semialdehyde decarboxylase
MGPIRLAANLLPSLRLGKAPLVGRLAIHGATVVGLDVRELVFRAIAMCQNAEYQMRALALGSFGPLTPGETRLAAAINLSPGPLSRAWDYWTARAEQAGAGPGR